MRRHLALLTTVVALLLAAALPAMGAPAVDADPAVCLYADVNVNDELVIDEALCLPPDGGGELPVPVRLLGR